MEMEDDPGSSPIDLRLCDEGNHLVLEYLGLLREVLHVAGFQGLPVWRESLDLALTPLTAHVAGCPACNEDQPFCSVGHRLGETLKETAEITPNQHASDPAISRAVLLPH